MKEIIPDDFRSKVSRFIELTNKESHSVCNECGGNMGDKLAISHHCEDGLSGRLIPRKLRVIWQSYKNGKCKWVDSL